jgi:hypothetical protein
LIGIALKIGGDFFLMSINPTAFTPPIAVSACCVPRSNKSDSDEVTHKNTTIFIIDIQLFTIKIPHFQLLILNVQLFLYLCSRILKQPVK